LARGINQESRRAIGAIDHVLRRPDLAAAVRHNPHVARESLRQCIEIARLGAAANADMTCAWRPG
jgi:hypothetical protein